MGLYPPSPRMPLRYYLIFSTFLLHRKETVLLQVEVTYQFLLAVKDLGSPSHRRSVIPREPALGI